MQERKSSGRLLIFCGIPGSGKTTLAHMVASSIGAAVHIQTDTIRFMIPAPTYTWQEGRFVYNSMFLLGREALRRGYDTILDGTFLKEDYRAEAMKKLGGYYSVAVVVCVECDTEVARARNAERGAVVPDAPFDRLIASFERPTRGAIFVRSDNHTADETAAYLLHELSKNRAWRANGQPTTTRVSSAFEGRGGSSL